MAEKTFHLEVITPERCAVEGTMTALQVEAVDGRLGVLARHAPLISALAAGPLRCRDPEGKETLLAVGEGFLEVAEGQVKVLCDFAEFPPEIDEERARRALERAKERLSHRSSPEVDEMRAEAALRRAMVRLQVRKGATP